MRLREGNVLDARFNRCCPTRGFKKLPCQKFPIISHRIEPFFIQWNLVEEQTVRQAFGLDRLVMHVWCGTIGSNQCTNWHRLIVSVRTEPATHWRIHLDFVIIPDVKSKPIELAIAGTYNNPIKDAAGPNWWWQTKTRYHSVLLDVGI